MSAMTPPRAAATSRGPTRHPRSVAFRRAREAEWSTLDALVERALKQGLKTLSADELHQLPILYRAVLSSLSVARKTALDRALVDYLDALAARAFLAVYGARRSTRHALRRALFVEFPRRVRGLLPELALSTALVLLGAVVSVALMQIEPGWYDAFVSPALSAGRDPQASTQTLRAALYGGGEMGEGLGFFASFLFTHNLSIGLLCVALGFAGGIPTALLLFQNGLMLGAFFKLYADRGLLFELGGWLLPHGVPEIGAVILCGAAGLHLGRALFLPGRLRVRRALSQAGRRVSMVVVGTIPLFAIAGLIEGIFRQSVTNDMTRYALGVFNLCWFFAWLILAGREAKART